MTVRPPCVKSGEDGPRRAHERKHPDPGRRPARPCPRPGRRPSWPAGTKGWPSRPSTTSRATRRAGTAPCSGRSRTPSPSRASTGPSRAASRTSRSTARRSSTASTTTGSRPEEGKWTYTYHKRLFAYDIEGETVDQIAAAVDRLARTGHTRRAQAITWNPKLDAPTDDPPCLQRLWFRILRGRRRRAGPEHELPLAVARRLQGRLHERLRPDRPPAGRSPRRVAEKTGRAVRVGRYADLVDSFHIYGSYFAEFEGFLKMVEKRTFDERTWPSAYAEPMFEEARERLRREKEEGR
ncbi:MAG: hypothetical protein MZW92_09905 [Comamonadaceae bacterium]|nr:hypothetical protein [Comamonadaceae bacterium]